MAWQIMVATAAPATVMRAKGPHPKIMNGSRTILTRTVVRFTSMGVIVSPYAAMTWAYAAATNSKGMPMKMIRV